MVAVAAALQVHFLGFCQFCSGASELMTSAVCTVLEEVVQLHTAAVTCLGLLACCIACL